MAPITADNSPTFFEAESLPDGLSVDGLTGVISGSPETEGEFEVTILAGNDGGSDQATLVLTVNRAATPFATWSGGAPSTPELILVYGVGGAPGPEASGETPAVTHGGGDFILTTIIRTDDPDLSVVAEAAAELESFATSSGVTIIQGSALGVSQAGVPSGCERQEFRISTQVKARLFMRLRAQLLP